MPTLEQVHRSKLKKGDKVVFIGHNSLCGCKNLVIVEKWTKRMNKTGTVKGTPIFVGGVESVIVEFEEEKKRRDYVALTHLRIPKE